MAYSRGPFLIDALVTPIKTIVKHSCDALLWDNPLLRHAYLIWKHPCSTHLQHFLGRSCKTLLRGHLRGFSEEWRPRLPRWAFGPSSAPMLGSFSDAFLRLDFQQKLKIHETPNFKHKSNQTNNYSQQRQRKYFRAGLAPIHSKVWQQSTIFSRHFSKRRSISNLTGNLGKNLCGNTECFWSFLGFNRNVFVGKLARTNYVGNLIDNLKLWWGMSVGTWWQSSSRILLGSEPCWASWTWFDKLGGFHLFGSFMGSQRTKLEPTRSLLGGNTRFRVGTAVGTLLGCF